MKTLISAVAAATLALAATFAFAQGGPGGMGGPGMGGGQGMGPGGQHHGMKPCSQEADPAKCEANRKQMRENMKAAREACKDNADKHGCMAKEFCAKQADPAKCQERANEQHQRMSKRMDEHQAAAEACTGKRGDDLQKCLQAQREKMHGGDKK